MTVRIPRQTGAYVDAGELRNAANTRDNADKQRAWDRELDAAPGPLRVSKHGGRWGAWRGFNSRGRLLRRGLGEQPRHPVGAAIRFCSGLGKGLKHDTRI